MHQSHKAITTLSCLLIFLFFTLSVQCIQVQHLQRGGGSRGGGGGFSGGRSYGRSYGGYGYGGYGSGGSWIGGAVFGGLIGCCCLCFVCAALCDKCKKWSNIRKLRNRFNTIDTSSISQQQYVQDRNRIVELINMSSQIYNFSYSQNSETTRIIAKATLQKQAPYNTVIKLTGTDTEGDWTAEGNIICKNGSVSIWYLKDYQDKARAGQNGQWEILVYESSGWNQGALQGKWYFDGFQDSPEYSGTWKLWEPTNPYFTNPSLRNSNNANPSQNAGFNPYGNLH